MEEKWTTYHNNSAVPIIITSIIGKHIDNVNPGGEERFKLSSRAPRYYDLFPADFVNFFYVTHDELSERVTTCSLVTSL